jgi:hypothetical protein
LERKYLSCFLCPFPSQFIFPPLLKGRVREGLSKNLPPVSPLFKEGGRKKGTLIKRGEFFHYFSLPFLRGG